MRQRIRDKWTQLGQQETSGIALPVVRTWGYSRSRRFDRPDCLQTQRNDKTTVPLWQVCKQARRVSCECPNTQIL